MVVMIGYLGIGVKRRKENSGTLILTFCRLTIE